MNKPSCIYHEILKYQEVDVLKLTLWFSYLFERSKLVLWPISSGPYFVENIALGHRLASRFQPVVGYKSTP